MTDKLVIYPIKAASRVRMVTDPYEAYTIDKKHGKTTFMQRLQYEYLPAIKKAMMIKWH